MEKPWMKSILQLQDIVKENTTDNSSSGAQEHLQCLIDCINELYTDHKQLKYELEKTSIKANGLRYRYYDKYVRVRNEQKNLTKRAKRWRICEVESIEEQQIHLEEEVNEIDQKSHELEDANEKLVALSEYVKEKITKFQEVTNKAMSSKHQATIKCKENRLNAYDAHDRAYGLIEAIVDVSDDVKEIVDKNISKINEVKTKANVWNTKVTKADKEVEEVKNGYDVVEERLQFTRQEKIRCKEDLFASERMLSGYYQSVTKHKKNLQKRTSEKEVVETAKKTCERNYKNDTTSYQKKITYKDEVIESLEQHSLIENELKADYEKKKKDTTEVFEEKRKILNVSKAEVKVLKEDVDEWHERVNVKMEDIVAIRAQRMWFKEQLILVADKRETMENVYAMQFDEQYAKLRTETVLRMQAAREATSSLEEHEEFMTQFDLFRRSCLDATNFNKTQYERLQESGNKLEIKLTAARVKENEAKTNFESRVQLMLKAKINSAQQLKALQESITSKRADVRHLRSEFVDPLEARVSDLKSAIKKLSESKRILMDNYTNRHNNKNIAREALAKIGFSIKRRQKETNVLAKQEELLHLKAKNQLLRHQLDVRNNATQIYLWMARLKKISNENELIKQCVTHLLVQREELKDHFLEQQTLIFADMSKIDKCRAVFGKLLSEESVMTEDALSSGRVDLVKMRQTATHMRKRSTKLTMTSDQINDVLSHLNETTSEIMFNKKPTQIFLKAKKKKQKNHVRKVSAG